MGDADNTLQNCQCIVFPATVVGSMNHANECCKIVVFQILYTNSKGKMVLKRYSIVVLKEFLKNWIEGGLQYSFQKKSEVVTSFKA